MNIQFKRELLFQSITSYCRKKISDTFLQSLKTDKGLTQKSERQYIQFFRNTFQEMGLSFQEAGSQQSKDFRIFMDNKISTNSQDNNNNNNNNIFYLEIKKTDTANVIFNDTCPSGDIYYFILFTGTTKIKPQFVAVNGSVFLAQDPWIESYLRDINELKSKYKSVQKNIHVYPRPTFSSNIRFLLK